jgi:hypothetical protein
VPDFHGYIRKFGIFEIIDFDHKSAKKRASGGMSKKKLNFIKNQIKSCCDNVFDNRTGFKGFME